MFLLEHSAQNVFISTSAEYLSALFDVLKSCGDLEKSKSELYSTTARFILENGLGNATYFSFQIIDWGVKQGTITYEEALYYVKNNIEAISADWEIRAVIFLLEATPNDTPTHNCVFC